MIAPNVAKLKNFFAGKRNFSLSKAKKEKNLFVWKVWINSDVLIEVREKSSENCFCNKPMSV